MKRIAVRPARGGSKRIPKKNIIDFMGKPMIAWTITAAINSNIFDRIIVSTDDLEIAKVSEKYGCEVPFLRNDKSDDFSPVSEATIHCVNQAEKYFKESYETVVQLMANAPIRDENDIKNHLDNFEKNKRNFQISSFKFGWMNPWWAFKLSEDKKHTWMLPDGVSKRSQDLPNLYCPTGSVWIANKEKLISSNSFYGKDFVFEEINWKSAVDIDDYEDLEFAKAVYLLKNNY
jgi:CMP-N-acetylneuraminic acid synthetase